MSKEKSQKKRTKVPEFLEDEQFQQPLKKQNSTWQQTMEDFLMWKRLMV